MKQTVLGACLVTALIPRLLLCMQERYEEMSSTLALFSAIQNNEPGRVRTIVEQWPHLKDARCGVTRRAIVEQYGAARDDEDNKQMHYPTPLNWAVICNRPAILEILLKAGANPNILEGTSHYSPLLCALDARRRGMVNPLLDHGANANLECFTQSLVCLGDTQLFRDMAHKNKVHINEPDDEGNTLLHYAVIADQDRDAELTQAALDAGADPGRRNRNGVSPLQYIMDYYFRTNKGLAIIRALCKADRPAQWETDDLCFSIRKQRPEVVAALLSSPHTDGIINGLSVPGITPLHWALRIWALRADVRNLALAKQLLETGADPNVMSNAHTPGDRQCSAWYTLIGSHRGSEHATRLAAQFLLNHPDTSKIALQQGATTYTVEEAARNRAPAIYALIQQRRLLEKAIPKQVSLAIRALYTRDEKDNTPLPRLPKEIIKQILNYLPNTRQAWGHFIAQPKTKQQALIKTYESLASDGNAQPHSTTWGTQYVYNFLGACLDQVRAWFSWS